MSLFHLSTPGSLSVRDATSQSNLQCKTTRQIICGRVYRLPLSFIWHFDLPVGPVHEEGVWPGLGTYAPSGETCPSALFPTPDCVACGAWGNDGKVSLPFSFEWSANAQRNHAGTQVGPSLYLGWTPARRPCLGENLGRARRGFGVGARVGGFGLFAPFAVAGWRLC
jgi:hypothetical protein